MHLITDNIQRLIALCRKHKVSKLYAFGSILTSRFNENSDVDILVDFTSEIDYNSYAIISSTSITRKKNSLAEK